MKFQKVLFISIIFSCSSIFLSAQQQLINGGFEETYVDSVTYLDDYLIPSQWRFGWNTMGTSGCGPYLGKLTNDSHSGNWAVEMETLDCVPLVSGSVGNGSGPAHSSFLPEIMAQVINARPDQLSFYYKFNPVGGDSARFSALLFNYPDSLYTNEPGWFDAIDTVAYIHGTISDSTDQYLQKMANFDYWSDDLPQYFHVFFSSSNNGSETFFPPAHAGTTLWVDDVELIYFTTSSENQLSAFDIQIFPNPVMHQFQIDAPGNFQPQSIVVFDNVGRVVRTMNPQDRFHSMNNLASGIFFLHIETEAGSVVKKLVKD